jgi:hypothetical protein
MYMPVDGPEVTVSAPQAASATPVEYIRVYLISFIFVYVLHRLPYVLLHKHSHALAVLLIRASQLSC